MKYIIRLSLSIGIFFCFSISGQTNLIKNGSFSDSTTNWDLGFMGTAQGSSSVSGGIYLIQITEPGEESWNVQFKQNGIKVDSGAMYRFSFEAAASKNRTIEVSISRDGGDYASYSGRDTIELTPTRKSFEYTFYMSFPSDTSTRVEFNCGLDNGTVSFSNVELVEIPGPLLTLNKPEPGSMLYEGYPVKISWYSVGNNGQINIDLSTDNGMSWSFIAGEIADTGSWVWIPEQLFSPWCLLRISSATNPEIFSTTDAPFQIAPRTELIRNGDFSSGVQGWNLGIYGGTASGSVTDEGVYNIEIDTAGTQSWHIQFTQGGINLKTGTTYTLSYKAYAEKPCSINVAISRYGDYYESYIDSSLTRVGLTAEPQQFTMDFSMVSDSNPDARIEFNCGLIDGNVFIDNISLTKKYVSVLNPAFKPSLRKAVSARFLTLSHGILRSKSRGDVNSTK